MEKRRRGRLESPSQSILHFTDREDEQELFARLLHTPAGEHLPVLAFYGVGGTGKSWLLRRLRESVLAASDVPSAHLDFSVDRDGELYHRDHAAALAEIQRQLGVECPRFEAAMRVYTEEALPHDWAMTLSSLGQAYRELPGGDRIASLQRALACFEAALRVYTEAALPQKWGMTLYRLGAAACELAEAYSPEAAEPDAERFAERQQEKRRWLTLGREHFLSAERAYRAIGRDDLAEELVGFARSIGEELAGLAS